MLLEQYYDIPAAPECLLIDDPLFYLAAIPAVMIFGIAKGGFGGGLGVLGVPILALVISPIQAAAILLPILCVMDLFTMLAYRKHWQWPELRILIPGALAGIGVGTLLFGYLDPAVVKAIVGVIAIGFSAHYWANKLSGGNAVHGSLARGYGVIAGAVGGFTSMIAHAGGPPITMYLLRRPVNRTVFIAITSVFFAVVNYVKLVPYAWLGQLSTENVMQSVILMPLAPLGVGMGVWMHRRVSDRFFFNLAYALLLLVGIKLIHDAVRGLA